MRLFVAVGLLTGHRFNDGPSRFETEVHAPHDHLIDVSTGKVVEFHDEEVARLQTTIAQKLGYRLIGYRLELIGTPLTTSSSVRSKRRKSSGLTVFWWEKLRYEKLAVIAFLLFDRSVGAPGPAQDFKYARWTIPLPSASVRCVDLLSALYGTAIAEYIALAHRADRFRWWAGAVGTAGSMSAAPGLDRGTQQGADRRYSQEFIRSPGRSSRLLIVVPLPMCFPASGQDHRRCRAQFVPSPTNATRLDWGDSGRRTSYQKGLRLAMLILEQRFLWRIQEMGNGNGRTWANA